MRTKLLALVGGLGLGFCATAANAAPLIALPHAPEASNIVQVAQGCGPRMHRNFRGYCVWNHRPSAYYRYRPHPYYGGGYGRWNRWSPSDNVANQLNAQEARR